MLTILIFLFKKFSAAVAAAKCNVDQTTSINNAPFENTCLIAENVDNTTTLTEVLNQTTSISNAPFENVTLLTDFVDSTTELCRT